MRFSEHILGATELLQEARDKLTREINAYPTPISGCDTQFNHLLCERTRVVAALGALDQDVFVPTPRQLNPGDKIETR